MISLVFGEAVQHEKAFNCRTVSGVYRFDWHVELLELLTPSV